MIKKLCILILAFCISLTACSVQKASDQDNNKVSGAETTEVEESEAEAGDTKESEAEAGDAKESEAEAGDEKEPGAEAGNVETAGTEASNAEAADTASTAATSGAAEYAQAVPEIEANIYNINKYGNITLSILAESMKELGYEPADIISVRIGDSEMEMPIGTAYSDADSGEPVCCYKVAGDLEVVVLSVNSGNMAETLGVAEFREIDADPGYEWVYLNGLDESAAVRISMVRKQGYANDYEMHKLGNTRTNNRNDYAGLSDDEYANFRVIETTGMGKGILCRSSSPVNPSLNRNEEADKALLDAGVRTVLNMADNESGMKQYADYSLTNYSECDIIALNMAMDLYTEDFQNKLAEGLRFIISHDGPYLIHCTEGKDRTGFGAAVLECLMGADAEEIISDYMLSFYNFNGVEPGTEQYEQIAASNIDANLARAFGISSIQEENTDLQACAEAYLLDIGMSAEEISALKEKLSESIDQ